MRSKDASVDVGVSYMHGQNVNFKGRPYDTFRSEGKAWLSVRTSTTRSNRTEIKKGEHCSPFLFTRIDIF
jgi:long-chain fatty acid transport protein